MAVGKNKRKPRTKKKVVDPFKRKQWFSIKAPGMFRESFVGRTVVNKTSGNNLSSDALKGRVFQVSLGDLNNDEELSYKTIHLIAEDVVGDEVLCNFHGMSFASHKLKSLIRKWRTLIEAIVDINTSDGYKVRLFVIGFTKKRPNQRRITSYATSAQIRQIRKKIFEIVKRESADTDLRSLFKKLILETISNRIETETQGIYPLNNVYVHKLKILNKPPFDRVKLNEIQNESPEDFGLVQKKGEVEEEFGVKLGNVDDESDLGSKKHQYSEIVTEQM